MFNKHDAELNTNHHFNTILTFKICIAWSKTYKTLDKQLIRNVKQFFKNVYCLRIKS